MTGPTTPSPSCALRSQLYIFNRDGRVHSLTRLECVHAPWLNITTNFLPLPCFKFQIAAQCNRVACKFKHIEHFPITELWATAFFQRIIARIESRHFTPIGDLFLTSTKGLSDSPKAGSTPNTNIAMFSSEASTHHC